MQIEISVIIDQTKLLRIPLWIWHATHPGLTRVSSIRFHLFEIKLVLFYNSATFYLMDLFFFYTFSFEMYMATKKYLKKGKTIMFNGSNMWSKVTAFWNIGRTVKSTWYVEERGMEKYGDDGIDKERGLWERRGRQDIGEEGLGGR